MAAPLAGSVGDGEHEVDLSEVARVRGRFRRIRRYGWLCLVAFCAFLSLLVWQASGGRGSEEAVALFPPVVGGFAYFLVCREPYGQLSRLRIGLDSIQCFYEDGTDETLRPSDPAFGLNIVGDDDGDEAGEWGTGVITVETPSGRSPIVTPAVVEQILAVARRLGAPVLVRRELRPVVKGVRVVRVARVGRPEQTPGWDTAQPVRQT